MEIDLKENKTIYHHLNNVLLIYAIRDEIMTFTCLPITKESELNPHSLYKDSWKQYFLIDPMVQIARQYDDVLRDFSASETSYNSKTSFLLKAKEQIVIDNSLKKEIRTILKCDDGLVVTHVVSQKRGYSAFEMYLEVENNGETMTFDRISSFNISALSPVEEKNDLDNIFLHKLQSYWSIEARKESEPISKYNFDDSWSGLGIKVNRIGALGAMPARNYNPFIALEDKLKNVCWAVQLEAPNSWEIETIHKYGRISLCGGQADYLYGHWRKILAKGEKFVTKKAYVSVVEGDLTKACANLTRYHDNLYKFPAIEEDLPIVYNEYLNSWGKPTIKNIIPQLDVASKLGAEYFVIDAGWFGNVNDDVLGDWDINKDKFPNGLKEFSLECKKRNFKACGIWYEFEGVTKNSKVAQNQDFLAKLEGKPISRDKRMFLDFNKKEVFDYLTEKVINNLKDNELNYIKIDYNENIGYGVDGFESPGEGLRKHCESVQNFMKKLRDTVPNLVLENCASGGLRHEISFDNLGSMISFSDAHEIPGGVVIAMDLHRIMQPRIMQIWACVLPNHTNDYVYFTMAKSMLGRICLSGKLEEISLKKKSIISEGIKFYSKLKNIIKYGETILIDTDEVESIKDPIGTIRLMRKSNDGNEIVYYIFSFNKHKQCINLEMKGYEIVDSYSNVSIINKKISLNKKDYSCAVVLYKKGQ